MPNRFKFTAISIALFGGGLFLYSMVANNMGFTETRARNNAQLFVKENNIQVERTTCAGDSDHDGYGSCAVKTARGELIRLQCPTDWINVNLWRATGCKEVVNKLQVIQPGMN